MIWLREVVRGEEEFEGRFGDCVYDKGGEVLLVDYCIGVEFGLCC